MGKGAAAVCGLSLRLAHGFGRQKNFRNSVGGTYDCIAIMSYYAVCKAVTSFCEIEENLILPSFRKLKFVDCNKLFWQKLMYKAFRSGL